jgi:hypothetical protein
MPTQILTFSHSLPIYYFSTYEPEPISDSEATGTSTISIILNLISTTVRNDHMMKIRMKFFQIPFLYLWPTPIASWWSGLPLSFWHIGQELDCVILEVQCRRNFKGSWKTTLVRYYYFFRWPRFKEGILMFTYQVCQQESPSYLVAIAEVF